MSKVIYINENQKERLFENRAGKNMNLGKNYLMQQGMSQEQALQVIGSIKHDIPNARMGEQKFMLGLCRLYMSGELRDSSAINRLNQMLKYVASDAHINEYDSNLNNLTANEIIERFSGIRNSSIDQEKEMLGNKQYSNSDYTIVRIPDFETASQYGDYTSWCVTHNENMYESYTNNSTGIFYFCLKNGFENVQEIKGEDCPLDEYGLSMIAVSVDEDGAPNTITCRWNHDNGGNDNIMTPEEVSDIIGKSFYDAFPPRMTEEERKQKFDADIELFKEAMYWRHETMEYYYNDEDELVTDDDENEFEYHSNYGTFDVTVEQLAETEDYLIKLSPQWGRGENDRVMIFDYAMRPKLSRVYNSYQISQRQNIVVFYPTEDWGNGIIYHVPSEQVVARNVYSFNQYGLQCCITFNDDMKNLIIDNNIGKLCLSENVDTIYNMGYYTKKPYVEILDHDHINFFNYEKYQYVLPIWLAGNDVRAYDYKLQNGSYLIYQRLENHTTIFQCNSDGDIMRYWSIDTQLEELADYIQRDWNRTLSTNENKNFKKNMSKTIIITEEQKKRLFVESGMFDKKRREEAIVFRKALVNALKTHSYELDGNTIYIDGYTYENGQDYATRNEDGKQIDLHYTLNTVKKYIDNLLTQEEENYHWS